MGMFSSLAIRGLGSNAGAVDAPVGAAEDEDEDDDDDATTSLMNSSCGESSGRERRPAAPARDWPFYQVSAVPQA
jgi:hypothetical protein